MCTIVSGSLCRCGSAGRRDRHAHPTTAPSPDAGPNMLSVAICCLTVALGVCYMILSITIVPAGTVGVVDIFGDVRDTPVHAGLNFVFPLASVCLRCFRAASKGAVAPRPRVGARDL